MGSKTVTAIMTVFRRGGNFEEQVNAVLGQSKSVDKVIVVENGMDKAIRLRDDRILYIRSEANLGVWLRFSIALMAETDYVWILDDDFVPGIRWLENVFRTEERTGTALFGSRGIIFNSKHNYLEYEEVGTHNPNERAMQVDIVGHNWVIKREYLGDFWGAYSKAFPSRFAGEDIHVSFALQSSQGIKTVVPPHPRENPELWGEKPTIEIIDGTGQEALSRSPEGLRRFEKALKHYRELGFETILHKGAQSENGLGTELKGRLIGLFPNSALKLAGFRRRLVEMFTRGAG